MSARLFEEIRTKAHVLGKWLRVEDCHINICYTQDQAPVKHRVWTELTFSDMKVVHPICIVDFEKEQLLIGQDLLNRLAPLIDYHNCQLWT